MQESGFRINYDNKKGKRFAHISNVFEYQNEYFFSIEVFIN